MSSQKIYGKVQEEACGGGGELINRGYKLILQYKLGEENVG